MQRDVATHWSIASALASGEAVPMITGFFTCPHHTAWRGGSALLCAHSAPEVLSGGRVDKFADVYSFGVIMWQLMMGCPVVHSKCAPLRLLCVRCAATWAPGGGPRAVGNLQRPVPCARLLPRVRDLLCGRDGGVCGRPGHAVEPAKQHTGVGDVAGEMRHQHSATASAACSAPRDGLAPSRRHALLWRARGGVFFGCGSAL